MSNFHIVLTDLHISDLFFNAENEQIHKWYRDTVSDQDAHTSDDSFKQAVALDADAFVKNLPVDDDTSTKLKEWLVKDYMSRL